MGRPMSKPRFFVRKEDGSIQVYVRESDMMEEFIEGKLTKEDTIYEVGVRIFLRMKPQLFRRDPDYNRKYHRQQIKKRLEGASLDD